VPGPARALRLAGAPVVAIWPIAVLAANVRLGVAAVSYDGRLRCSIHFDAANVPGTEFAYAMGEELARENPQNSAIMPSRPRDSNP
jgi:diacylglycerol O-acyltransferase